MEDPNNFGDLINDHIAATGLGPNSLNRLSKERWGETGQITFSTLRNWKDNGARKRAIQEWQHIVRLALLWRLTEPALDQLLKAALLPPIKRLREENRSPADQKLFDEWAQFTSSSLEEIRPVIIPPVELPNSFVGRQRLLNQLLTFLKDNNQPRIACLVGMAGVGKTTTAAYLAKELRSAFPDGILWADLSITEPMTVLLHFAEELGKDVSHFPDIASRSMRVHSLLAGRRILIIVDNATSKEQLQWIIPHHNLCAVLVTTRKRDLAVTQQAVHFFLEPYEASGNESYDHFEQILGVIQAKAADAELRQIAEIVGHLPLALTLTANRIRLKHGYTAPVYLALLREKEARLHELFEEGQGIRLSFNVSYDSLPKGLQTFFCGLSAFPGNSFSMQGAAAVCSVDDLAARRMLGKLHDLCLVFAQTNGRYHLHPLLRDFALELNDDSHTQTRLIQYYFDFARENGDDFLQLKLEESNLISTLFLAFDLNPTVELIETIVSLYCFMRARGFYSQFNQLLLKAEAWLAIQNDPHHLADVLVHLGHIALKWGESSQAGSYYRQAVMIVESSANYPEKDRQLCRLYTSLAAFLHRIGQFRDAEKLYKCALELAWDTDDVERIVALLANLGVLATDLADYQSANRFFVQSLQSATTQVNEQRLMPVLLNYGYFLESKGAYLLADKEYLKGIELAEKYGDSEMKSWLLCGRCATALAANNYHRACEYYAEGEQLARELDNKQLISRFLAHRGRIALKDGRYNESRDPLAEAVLIARETGFKSDLCFNLIDLADAEVSLGELEQAKSHLAEAHKIASEAPMPVQMARVAFGQAKLAERQGDVSSAYYLARESLFALKSIQSRYANEVILWLSTNKQDLMDESSQINYGHEAYRSTTSDNRRIEPA